MRQIICLSTSDYRPVPTRKQNVMSRLKDAEILYFDPPVTWIAPLKDRNALRKIFAWRRPGEQVKENITVYATPPVLPFFNRYRWINRINQRLLAGYLKKRMKQHGFTDPLLWCYSPSSCDLVDRVPSGGLVYDCVDRHSAYRGMIRPEVVDQMERELARKADQVFCTAQGLYDTLVRENPNTGLIPNGAAYELFSRVFDLPPDPDRSKPVFGFVGMLQECIDYQCLAAVADAFPEGRVVIIGRRLPGVDLTELQAKKNVVFKGLVPQEELPEHMREFHVCLNVFREGRLSQDVSPLKFYEYLATGRPVVSTKEPLQVNDYADVVYVADSPAEFVIQCEKALRENDPPKSEKRREYGKTCSWTERVREMESILEKRRLT